MQQPEHEDRSARTARADESARWLTIILGAPLALLVSALALFQFL